MSAVDCTNRSGVLCIWICYILIITLPFQLIFSMFLQLEKGVDGLFQSFARLDSRISSVGQTAAKIGDHLQVNFVLGF